MSALSKKDEQRYLERIAALEQENKLLREQYADFRHVIRQQQLRIEELEKQKQTYELQQEELRTMTFGKKRKKEVKRNKKKVVDRPASSYQRKVPSNGEVTGFHEHGKVKTCPDCNTKLTDYKKKRLFIEDIVDPKQFISMMKHVVLHEYQQGYCKKCRRHHAEIPVSRHKVTLGENVSKHVVLAYIYYDMSYSQIKTFCQTYFGLAISDGEISNMLKRHAQGLQSYQTDLVSHLNSQVACHYDESVYPVQEEGKGKYVWTRTGLDGSSLFLIGRSRGKDNIHDLLQGAPDSQVAITDGYGAYTNMFKHHQLCWAHVHRKVRDLAQSHVLEKDVKRHCMKTYEEFSQIYEDIRSYIEQPFVLNTRRKQKQQLNQQLLNWSTPSQQDPEKLVKVKQHIQNYVNKYLTCLDFEGVPCDNNAAERALRPLVIKRKKSFGTKTQRGAETLGTLFSAINSILNRHPPQEFFKQYELALRAGE